VSRHVPDAVRDRVLERAGYQCEFVGPDGTRCTARTNLGIDHTRAFAIYRSHDERWLQAVCGMHNLLRAKQTFGPEYIDRMIEARRDP
jgi:hypothetical protein